VQIKKIKQKQDIGLAGQAPNIKVGIVTGDL
jgi:hypothetical protein